MNITKILTGIVGVIFAIAYVLFLFALDGCSAVQAKLDTQVQAATVPDLQAAVADAQAANDQDGVDCWTQVLAYVQSLPTANATTAQPQIAGIASALEAGRIASNQPLPSFPPVPHSLHKACAVLVVDAQQLALKLGISAGALAKGAPIVKGAVKAGALPP